MTVVVADGSAVVYQLIRNMESIDYLFDIRGGDGDGEDVIAFGRW